MPNNCSLQGTFRTWKTQQDEYGYRDYHLVLQVISADGLDGPANVLACPGLPVVGTTWTSIMSTFGTNDVDNNVYCKLVQSATQRIQEGEICQIWDVDVLYTNRPDLQKCETIQFQNPFNQCPRISGHSTKRTIEATLDWHNREIVNSAFEQIRGPNNEWDSSRTGVRVELNGTASLVEAAIGFLDFVNQGPIWGQGIRCVKLSNVTWEKKYYGNCQVYFSVIMDFDIANFEPGLAAWIPFGAGSWDRLILDEATKVLNGRWDETTGQYILLPIAGIRTPTVSPSGTLDIGGGTITDGTYYYEITAVAGGSGLETNAGPPGQVIISGGFGAAAIQLSWAIVPGASFYKIYGRPNTVGGTYGYIGSSLVGDPTFLDTNAVSPGVAPPATNGTLMPPDPTNPRHFIQFRDRSGNPIKGILNGAGIPADVGFNTGTGGTAGLGTIQGPGHIFVQYYQEANFTLLGIPVDYTASCMDSP